jgi:hypothetical protein
MKAPHLKALRHAIVQACVVPPEVHKENCIIGVGCPIPLHLCLYPISGLSSDNGCVVLVCEEPTTRSTSRERDQPAITQRSLP